MALAIYGWFHRSAQGALPFVVCMFLSAELMLASALSMTSPTYESAIFWGNMRFILHRLSRGNLWKL